MDTSPTTPPAKKQLIAALPFRSQQIDDEDANYDVSVWRGEGLVCEKRSHSPCDTVGHFYGSAEDEVTKFCPRHFYEMHFGRNAAYRIVDPPTLPGDGPWEVWDRADEIAIVDPYGEPIASCLRSNILDERVVRVRLQLAADAPALLTALRDVLDEADSDEVHDHERTGCDECAFCRAKALAAKYGR